MEFVEGFLVRDRGVLDPHQKPVEAVGGVQKFLDRLLGIGKGFRTGDLHLVIRVLSYLDLPVLVLVLLEDTLGVQLVPYLQTRVLVVAVQREGLGGGIIADGARITVPHADHHRALDLHVLFIIGIRCGEKFLHGVKRIDPVPTVVVIVSAVIVAIIISDDIAIVFFIIRIGATGHQKGQHKQHCQHQEPYFHIFHLPNSLGLSQQYLMGRLL